MRCLLRKKLPNFLWAILAGSIILIVPWDGDRVDIIGLLLVFVAGLFWAGYMVVGSKATKTMKGLDVVGMTKDSRFRVQSLNFEFGT